MRATTMSNKSGTSPFAGETLTVIGAGLYILLSVVFIYIENYFIRTLGDPEDLFKCISLTYIIITVAALIFPLLLIGKKKIAVAAIITAVSFLLGAAALYSTIFIPGCWVLTMALPFMLFIPYIWHFIGKYKTK